MEYFWYILAAIGAGVGTGLAGISAATVMVPILIVLCPSFAGEQGAYHATAIALASDILGSAVTTGVYIKHKNIDLKRGWIMLVCILSMCIAGSFVAFQAGNVVLGGFSLFLTFGIGIRFLLKPDTERKETVEKAQKFSLKDIAISLFFGLTIGFGTGFVGTGGGMMMLVVFTAFLGMQLKTAVGTSTFIMTFTALIASVSHMAIDTSILVQRWDVLLICVVTATIASLVSAQFANKVKNRTVGLVTGVVLTVLGGAMLILNYLDTIRKFPIVFQVLDCCKYFGIYIVVGAVVLIVLNFTLKIPRYIFRKLLHIVAFSSVAIMVSAAENWQAAALTSCLFALVIYPILRALENCQWYDHLFVQKKKGEIKLSLMVLFFSMAAMIAFAWGLMGTRYIAITTILIWGCGDAAAAICGNRFGKHVIKSKLSDGKKTWEGTIAMAVTAFVVAFACLMTMAGMPWYLVLVISVIVAPVAAFVELVSKGGWDTLTVPVSVVLLLEGMIYFM